MEQLEFELPKRLREILERTPELRRSFLVGGCVRDRLLGLPITDFDIEVFDVSGEALQQGLQRWGRTDLVGRSFGVFKLQVRDGHVYDFSLPRRDSKVAPGHRGFLVEFDKDLPLPEAAARRDFTINSMMFDPRQGCLIDFFGGQKDLETRVLRHTSPAFSDDPLRVLRGMQFASRFRLEAAPETQDACRSISSSFSELAVERIRGEWQKWASKSASPSHGLRFLLDAGWLGHFPEIDALRGVEQEPEWHPEGDVFAHVCHCLDALVQMREWIDALELERLVLTFAVLAHDFAKPVTTHKTIKDGVVRIVAPGHEAKAGPIAETFLGRIGIPPEFTRRIVRLVTNHMAHLQTQTDRSVRRLAARLVPETIENLCTVIRADQFGRPPRSQEPSATLLNLQQRARELGLRKEAPKPILSGRDLLNRGLTPSPRFKRILNAAFEAQLDAAFEDSEGAEHWLTHFLSEEK